MLAVAAMVSEGAARTREAERKRVSTHVSKLSPTLATFPSQGVEFTMLHLSPRREEFREFKYERDTLDDHEEQAQGREGYGAVEMVPLPNYPPRQSTLNERLQSIFSFS